MVVTTPPCPAIPIVYANEVFLDLSGYEMYEILGQQSYFMDGESTDPADAAPFRGILEADQSGVVETAQDRKDGSRFTATALLSAYKDDDGRASSITS